MKAPSLRIRLLAGGLLAIFLALALAWVGLFFLFHRHAERRETDLLIRQAERLTAGIAFSPDGVMQLNNPPRDARFDRMASGLYWQLTGKNLTLHSASLWDQSLPLPARRDATQWQDTIIEGPFNERLLVVQRLIHFGQQAVVVQVALDDKEIRQANTEFGQELAGSLALLWLVLAGAAWAQVHLGLRPLARIGAEMERLRRSPAARLPDSYPIEVAPLITAINGLAETREGDLKRARKSAADLAHSLKTPLSALSAESRKARAAGADTAADGLDRAISAIGAALEAELARARSAAARASVERVDSVQILQVVEGLIGVIERTEQGERLIMDANIAPDLHLPVATQDLAEILGALIENAARHARRRVYVHGALSPERVMLVVEDDGPGIDRPLLDLAIKRGQRLDEAGAGHGLGLAIVSDLIDATDGDMAFSRSDLGGLSVSLTWEQRR